MGLYYMVDLKNENVNENELTVIDKINKLLDLDEKFSECEERIGKLENEFNNYKNNTDKLLESYYQQFTTIFLYSDFKAKSFLKYNHLLNLELLDFLDNLCKKYGLEYWLDCGSLLGAIRHNGFIPWDDDIDVCMIRKDYDKLVEIIEYELKCNGLSDDLIISMNVNSHKLMPALQLLYSGGLKGTILAGLDIAPYDFIEDISICNSEYYKQIQKIVYDKNREGIHINDAVKYYINEFKVSYETKPYMIPGVDSGYELFEGYHFHVLDTEKIFPLKKIEFENKLYYAPKDADYYLTNIYGEYFTMPKLIHHHYHRFDILKRMENGIEFYKEQIFKMKKVNGSY